MPLVSAETHRLPAVPLPRSVMEEPLSDIQRQRMELVDVFEAPHNLPVAEYAKMAGKSRRWISYEIKAGNLLALNLGNRGQRVPDWHLDPVKHALIQAVLKLTRAPTLGRSTTRSCSRARAARPLGPGKRQRHRSRQDHHGGEHDGEGKRVVPAAGGVCVVRQRPAVRAPVSGHGARAAGESFLGLGQDERGRSR